jgi:hypothetical protein
LLAENHGDELGRRVLRSGKKPCSRTPIRRSAKHNADEDIFNFSTTTVTKKKKIRPDRERGRRALIGGSWKRRRRFASGSHHRSTAPSHHTTTGHREQLELHHGQAPNGIAPNSTGVKPNTRLGLRLNLTLSTPAPIFDHLRLAIPTERPQIGPATEVDPQVPVAEGERRRGRLHVCVPPSLACRLAAVDK